MKDGVYLTTEAKRRWQREYYFRNREKYKESSRQYRETHKNQVAAYQKRYSMTLPGTVEAQEGSRAHGGEVL